MQSKNKIVIIILSVLLLISIFFNVVLLYRELRASGSYEDSAAEDSAVYEVSIGGKAPDFSAKLLTGDTFTLSENKGKVVFLNFWATWCGPCVAEMPAIQELSETYADSVVFIGMNYAEDTKKVQDFVTKRGITYNIGIDENGDIAKNLYPTTGIPYTLVIDAEGIISEIFLGGGDKMHDIFNSAITEALKR